MAEAASATAGEQQAVPVKRGVSVWLVIIVCVVVAAAAAGGVAYFVAGGKPAAEAAGGEKAQAAKAKPKGPAIYVKLDPPFVVNFEARGMMRFLQVTVEVLTRDAATADLLKAHDAKIRNDLLMLFGTQTHETLTTREGKEQLRVEALQVAAAVIDGEGGVGSRLESLYFTSFVMQ